MKIKLRYLHLDTGVHAVTTTNNEKSPTCRIHAVRLTHWLCAGGGRAFGAEAAQDLQLGICINPFIGTLRDCASPLETMDSTGTLLNPTTLHSKPHDPSRLLRGSASD